MGFFGSTPPVKSTWTNVQQKVDDHRGTAGLVVGCIATLAVQKAYSSNKAWIDGQCEAAKRGTVKTLENWNIVSTKATPSKYGWYNPMRWVGY